MRKLKLFLLLAVAAGSLFSLTACKDDDDKNNSSNNNVSSSIVGTWRCSTEYYILTYTFSADGRFTETWSESDGKSGVDYGTYTYDGSVLMLRYDDGDVDSYPAVIMGNTLSMDGDVYIKQ